ncbi:hypothetical protein D3C73_593250 [compost metagenome]
MVRNGLITAKRLVLLRGVVQHHGVFTRLVAEKEINAFQLHQTRNKVVAALLVLHAIFPIAVVTGELVLHLHAIFVEHRFDDVRHPLVLEYTLVAVPLQRPQVRLHGQRVNHVALTINIRTMNVDPGDFSVEIAWRSEQPLSRDSQGNRLAKHGPAVQAGVGAEHRHAQFK